MDRVKVRCRNRTSFWKIWRRLKNIIQAMEISR
jgi:hypothetical protein